MTAPPGGFEASSRRFDELRGVLDSAASREEYDVAMYVALGALADCCTDEVWDAALVRVRRHIERRAAAKKAQS